MSRWAELLKSSSIFSAVTEGTYWEKGTLVYAEVPKEKFMQAAQYLHDSGMDYLMLLTPYEDAGTLKLVYHFFDSKESCVVELSTSTDTGDLTMPTLTGIWPGANWHEREAYDMFGIKFEGHPNLERILQMKDSERYPLWKSYKLKLEGNE